jgi:hypothetical protein
MDTQAPGRRSWVPAVPQLAIRRRRPGEDFVVVFGRLGVVHADKVAHTDTAHNYHPLAVVGARVPSLCQETDTWQKRERTILCFQRSC